MTDGVKTLLDAALPKGKDGHMLLLPERHDLPGAQLFAEMYAAEMADRGTKTHFIEPPYWFNPVLKAHFDGKVSDEELRGHMDALLTADYITNDMRDLWAKKIITSITNDMRDLWAKKIITSKNNGILSMGIDVRSSSSWMWNDRAMQGLSERYDEDPDDLTIEQKSMLRAWEFKNTYPEVVQYRPLIEYMQESNIPEDAIHAVVASLHMEDRGGNALMTYGAAHLVGSVRDEDRVQGIIDEILEERGIDTHG